MDGWMDGQVASKEKGEKEQNQSRWRVRYDGRMNMLSERDRFEEESLMNGWMVGWIDGRMDQWTI